MALYTSIDTRFGETYTEESDNFTDFINDSAIPLQVTDNIITFSSNTSIQWDGSVGSVSDTDLIAFNRSFIFGEDGETGLSSRRLTGTTGTNAGKHAYFVNCTFIFNGVQESGSGSPTRRALLGASATDWDVSREYAVPDTKSGNGTFNFYNCKFIYNMDASVADGNNNIGLTVGDFVDNTFVVVNPNAGELVIYPQPNSNITGNVTDFTTRTTSSTVSGSIYQIDGAGPAKFENNTIQNFYVYPVDITGTFEAPFLEANNTIPYVANNGGAAPANPPVIRLQDFGSQFTNTSIIASTKSNLRQNGNIYWRNSRSTGSGGPYNRPRVIASRRFERTAYTTAAQDTTRSLIRYNFEGNVEYTTAGSPHTINVASSNTSRDYITNANGIPEGTYNFVDGSSSASVEEKEKLDVPISYFRADTTQAQANVSDFYTEEFNFSTTLTAISLLGQTNYTTVYDSEEWAANDSEAAARDGFWIRRDNVNEVDIDDANMADYQDTETIVGLTSLDTDIDYNDIYAIYKYAVWKQDLGIGDYPYSNVNTSGIFDLSANTVDSITLTDNNSGSPYNVNGAFLEIQAGSLTNDVNKAVEGIKADNINLNNGIVTGGSLEGNSISLPKTYTDIPLETELSFDGVELAGIINLNPASGETLYLQFKDCTKKAGSTLSIANNGAGSVVYLFQGDAIEFDANVGDVTGLTTVIVVNADTEISTTLYNITDDTYPTISNIDSDTIKLGTVSNSTSDYSFASSGGDTTVSGLGGTITKVLVVGTKAGDDSFWMTVDVPSGSSTTVNVDTTVNVQYAKDATIVDGADIITSLETAAGNDNGKLRLTAVGLLNLGASATNKLMNDQRGTQHYRDALAIANDNGTELVYPVGLSDSGFDAAKVIWRTRQTSQTVTMSESNIDNFGEDFPNNLFSQSTTVTITIDDIDTEVQLRVVRVDVPTGVPGDTFAAGLRLQRGDFNIDMDNRLITAGNLGNLGLLLPVKDEDGNLVTTPDV